MWPRPLPFAVGVSAKGFLQIKKSGAHVSVKRSSLANRLFVVSESQHARRGDPLAIREPPAKGKRGRLVADDHALAAGGALDVALVVLGGPLGRVVDVATAGAAAVEHDALAGPRDAVALAGAVRRPAGNGRGGRAVGRP